MPSIVFEQSTVLGLLTLSKGVQNVLRMMRKLIMVKVGKDKKQKGTKIIGEIYICGWKRWECAICITSLGDGRL